MAVCAPRFHARSLALRSPPNRPIATTIHNDDGASAAALLVLTLSVAPADGGDDNGASAPQQPRLTFVNR